MTNQILQSWTALIETFTFNGGMLIVASVVAIAAVFAQLVVWTGKEIRSAIRRWRVRRQLREIEAQRERRLQLDRVMRASHPSPGGMRPWSS